MGGVHAGSRALSKLIVLFVFIFQNQTYAQSDAGYAVISNCYQSVFGSNTTITNYRFLKANIGGNIKFSSSNGDIQYCYVYYDNNGTWDYYNYFYMNQSDPLNSNFDKYKIVPVATSGSAANPKPIYIDFVDPEINPTDLVTECMTFNIHDFKINLNLDGFCNPPNVKIKLPSSAINRWGLDPNWSADHLYDGSNTNIPINSDFCHQNIVDQYGHIPCPCLTFDFEVTLYPCDGSILNCPEYTFTKQIDICCCCGYFDPTRE